MTQPLPKTPPPAAAADDNLEVALYEIRKKIYPRAVSGIIANWRIALVVITQLVFYGLPWLMWNERQAVLFDLAHRKFYIFGVVFWPQDFILLTGLLVIAALSLFLFTAIAGRLWCGFACPQTVYTQMFLWIEEWVEGDRPKRMKLDQQPLSGRKLRLKATKHALWIALSLWTGVTFVGYFTPIRELLGELAAFNLGPWEWFWVLFYGFATYGNAGWMREQVCKYMCPYARFQSVMFDSDTLIVTYDFNRGEPRGSRGRNVDRQAKGLGDCVDCGICVQVCPTGIDIRNGLQYECIGCGACVDGCNQVMDKMGYPRGLIRFSTENVIKHKYPDKDIRGHVLRLRTLIYTAILTAVIAAVVATLYLRVPLKVNIIRDRATLVRETREGLLENAYRIQIYNTAERSQRFTITASGIDGVQLALDEKQPIEVAGAASKTLNARLLADPANAKAGSQRVFFHVQSIDDEKVKADEKSSFYAR
ncbi:MAG: cytochrome c oxidase accessory protein CcoG [Pseudomonadota bacterium]